MRDRDESLAAAIDFANGLSLGELSEAVRALTEGARGPGRRLLLGAVFRRWGDLDPVGGRAAIASLGARRDRVHAEQALYTRWALADGPSAMAEALESGSDEGALAAVVSVLAERDPTAAVGILEATTNGRARQRLQMRLVTGATEQGTEEALLRVVLANEAMAGRDWLIGSLFEQWAAYDEEGPMRALSTIRDPDLLKEATKRMTTAWASADPLGAVDFVFTDPGLHTDLDVVRDVLMRALQEASPAETEAIARAMQERSRTAEIPADSLRVLSRTQPAVAADIAIRQARGAEHSRELPVILGLWQTRDPVAAAAYVDQLAKAGLPPAVFDRVAAAELQSGDTARIVRWFLAVPEAARSRAGAPVHAALLTWRERVGASEAEAFATAILEVPNINPALREGAEHVRSGRPVPRP
ncbi:hypothetical protein ASA1KI_12240 [Opitutales bacterium ASA1]|nr:hypothetical protein ASA1KI_12240 [Opitutales bacterium ASA1]